MDNIPVATNQQGLFLGDAQAIAPNLEGGGPGGGNILRCGSAQAAETGASAAVDRACLVYICQSGQYGRLHERAESTARQRALGGAEVLFLHLASKHALRKRERAGAGTLRTIRVRKGAGVIRRGISAARSPFRLWPHLLRANEIVCVEKPDLTVRLAFLLARKRYRLFDSEQLDSGRPVSY